MSKEKFTTFNAKQYRFTLFTLNGHTGILFCASHLIADAWTFSLIAKQAYEYYQQLLCNTDPKISNLSYLDIVQSQFTYLNSEKYKLDEVFWNEMYPLPPTPSPIKIALSSEVSPVSGRYTTTLTPEFSQAAQAFCRQHNFSPAIIFEAAVCAYLSRINEENTDVTIGVLILNRATRAEKQTAGMFISTLPLTVALTHTDSMLNLCTHISQMHRKIFRHQKYPYSEILKSVRKHGTVTGNLYDIMVSYQNAKIGIPARTQWYSNGYCEIPVEIHIDDRENTNALTLTIDYQTALFDKEEILLLLKRIEEILRQTFSDPQIALESIDILSPEERQLVLYDYNNSSATYPKDKCIHELFVAQSRRTPHGVAMVYKDQSYSYQQLDQMSNSVAHFLRSQGVVKNDVVAILLSRGPELIPSILGILKAGAAYLPIDISYPEERINFMISDSGAKFCITETAFNNAISYYSSEETHWTVDITQMCYSIYTSGSTGTPKMVGITHSNLLYYVYNLANTYRGSNIVMPLFTNHCVDLTVTSIFFPLVTGGTVYVYNEDLLTDLDNIVNNNNITIIKLTPTHMQAMNSFTIGRTMSNVHHLIVGGENLSAYDVKNFLQKFGEHILVHNEYGPTETTVGCGDYIFNQNVDKTFVPIGHPLQNVSLYVLDKKRRPLPIGAAGELCISGDGVGLGYINSQELTAEKFIPNPFSPGKVMYCSSDLARWRGDGELEYLGRMDTQVKLRGLRIELGEIENLMNHIPGIKMSAAAVQSDQSSRQYLVGYYTANTPIEESTLRQQLSQKLPLYMIPNYFVHLDEMPIASSGKINRKMLPIPDFSAQHLDYIAPETPIEKKLCTILKDLFGLQREIGVTENFFEVGGDSLRAIEYVTLAHGQGIELALQNIFDYPTVRQLSLQMEKGVSENSCYSADDFMRYTDLLARNVIDESFIPVKQDLGNVLLTGGTGFLGSHIIEQLLKQSDGKIYCLVRGGQDKIQHTLAYYFGNSYLSELGSRIIVIPGDITNDYLLDILPTDVGTVIHTAASVKHYGSYDYFEQVNVLGTKNIVCYAQKLRCRLIHISTLSVSGNSFADTFTNIENASPVDYSEMSFFVNQSLQNVYVRSKFEAERLVLDAALNGLDAKIIRVGNLTNRSTDLKFQENYKTNAFLLRIKAFLEFGYFPDYLLPVHIEFSPIEQTAEGIVKIAQYAGHQTVFHLNSDYPISCERFLQIIGTIGIHLQIVNASMFRDKMEGLLKDSETLYIYEAFKNDINLHGNIDLRSNVHISNNFTHWFLNRIGFRWKQIDTEYISSYIDYFCRLGYFRIQQFEQTPRSPKLLK
jgi:amino acid adenylation domain-containing protein/thioester reductase-like protein